MILSNDRLAHYKRKIVNFCVYVILGMLPYTAVPKLNFPPVLEEFIAEEHNNKMLDWTKELGDSKKYNSLQYDFWTRRQLTTQKSRIESKNFSRNKRRQQAFKGSKCLQSYGNGNLG